MMKDRSSGAAATVTGAGKSWVTILTVPVIRPVAESRITASVTNKPWACWSAT